MSKLSLIKSYTRIKGLLLTERSNMYTYQIKLNNLLEKREDKFEVSLEIEELRIELDQQKELVKCLEEEKDRLDEEIEKLSRTCQDDKEFKLFYYHYVKQLTLRDCANIMHYSYAQIKRINANFNKKNKDEPQMSHLI
ncbi:MAG: hypothetical protein IJU60_04780 [Acholeplasmatales bacterium]|nr:hypothetical protein [Acholeplasmatales bacterium]